MKTEKSVALRYDSELPAPFVAARGAGHLARKLVNLAREYGVPTVTEESLADGLFYLEVGDFIPESFYRAVAELLVFVMHGERVASAGDEVASNLKKSRRQDGSEANQSQ